MRETVARLVAALIRRGDPDPGTTYWYQGRSISRVEYETLGGA